MAVVALFFGIASFLVFFTFWFFFVSLIGIILASAAIFMIGRSEGSLTGLLPAQFGLALSIISLVAVSIMWPSYQYGLRLEADRFFRIWLDTVIDPEIPLDKKVAVLRGLTSHYWARPSTEDVEKWWKDLYENKYAHRDIHQYVEDDVLRTLLALGDRAKISYYKNRAVSSESDKDIVVSRYAVTYQTESGTPETFFIEMTGERSFPASDVKSAGWKLAKSPALVVPEEFKSRAKTPGTVRSNEPAP